MHKLLYEANFFYVIMYLIRRRAFSMARKKKKSKVRRGLRFIKLFLIIAIPILLGGLGGMMAAIISNIDRLDTLEYMPNLTTFIYDCNGEIITKLFSENRIPVPISQMPEHLLDAVVSIEDNRFYEHYGVDPKAIARALWVDIRHGEKLQGGSTITQQLAKNAFLTADKTLWRKIQDALLAIQLERKYTKREILELYLNEIYFGPNANGVEAAAQYYFGRHVWELDLAECALLAAIIQNPGRYSPFYRPENAKARRDLVLNAMVRYGYITSQEAAKAKLRPINVVKPKSPGVKAPYFIDYIKEELIAKYGEALLYKGGLRIYTTLDLRMQEIAERELFSQVPTGPINVHGVIQPQGALIALEPHTGYIKAMVGGRGGDDYFNRATKALRQPGSTIKPLYYAAAIETRRFTTASIIEDSPVEYPSLSADAKPWRPTNSDGIFRGPVTLREALAESMNVPSVKVLDALGIDLALQTIKKLGISTIVETGAANDRNLSSLGLGGLTRGISPMEMAVAYSAFANQGVMVQPIAILKVEDNNGVVLEEQRPNKTIVLSEATAYIVTDMLKDAVQNGTGRRAKIGRNEAGKTGTSNNFTNAWFVGYTPDLLTVVWLGNDNQNQPMIFGSKRIASGDTAEIWGRFMDSALKNRPITDFPLPASKSVLSFKVCPETGLLANEFCPGIRTEFFVVGSEPKESCQVHMEVIQVRICTLSGQIAGEDCPEDTIVVKSFQRDTGIEVDERGVPKPGGQTRPTENCTLHQKKPKFPFSIPPWW